jgi:cytochrome o ubiquinol oxidase subunit 3
MTVETTAIGFEQTDEFNHADTVANQVFGFWIYLMSDLILFATLFATFAVLRHNFAGGPTGKELFDLPYTLGETMFLLVSSATCGLVVLAMHHGRRELILLGLAITFLLGLGFVAMEINEFYGLILEGNGPDRSSFLSAFFSLVGTHGAHVTFGLIWIGFIMFQILRKGLTIPVQSRLTRLSMFWHFLDIVWIGIFTFVYLMGVM